MTSDKPKIKSNAGKLFVSLLLIALAAFVYWSPYSTLQEIRKDLHEGQMEKLDQIIDYATVREGLKRDFRAMAVEQVEDGSLKHKLLGLLGLAVGAPVVDPVVDYVVSPAGLRDVVEGVVPVFSAGQVTSSTTTKSVAPDGTVTTVTTEIKDTNSKTDGHYVDFNIFVATIHSPSGSATVLTFTRHGLMAWQLTHIKLVPTHKADTVSE